MPIPCTLRVTIYDDDEETPLWVVSTDPAEDNPFLLEPDSLAEQEIDAAECRASIGSVAVVLVDRAQDPTDQSTGWVTDKLAAFGIANLAGRRARVDRYYNAIAGWYVVIDGVVSRPAMHSSYAGYTFEVKDTREQERRLKAFITAGGANTILPPGTLLGYGYNAQDSSLLLDRTVQTPLLGRVVRPPSDGSGAENYNVPTTAYVDLTAIPGNDVTLRTIRQALYDLSASQSRERETFRTPPFYYFFDWLRDHFDQLEFWYRLQGDTGAFHIIPGAALVIDRHTDTRPNRDATTETAIKPLTFEAGAPDGFKQINRVFFGDSRAGNYIGGTDPDDPPNLYLAPDPAPEMPADGDDIELLLVLGGGPSQQNPMHLEGFTAGEFLVKLYRGDFTPAEVDGTVKTGVRYDEDALLEITEPIRLRLFEPITDARTWAEEHIFAPLGWIPAIDPEGRISPMTTEPPSGPDGLPVIDDTITEPSPAWNAGERIINIVRVTGARDYVPDDGIDPEAGDGLSSVPLLIKYEDTESVRRFGEQILEIDATAFRSIGQAGSGDPQDTGEEEAITRIARELGRRLLARYAFGAPTVELVIQREAYPLLRAGDFVILNLSWFPDYITQKRGLVRLAQVISLGDLDCAWRRVTCEMVPFSTPES